MGKITFIEERTIIRDISGMKISLHCYKCIGKDDGKTKGMFSTLSIYENLYINNDSGNNNGCLEIRSLFSIYFRFSNISKDKATRIVERQCSKFGRMINFIISLFIAETSSCKPYSRFS